MMETELLFHQRDSIVGMLEHRRRDLEREVSGLDPHYILNVSEEDLCLDVISKYSVDAPKLHEELRSVEEPDCLGDVVIGVTFIVPFEGDPKLFEYRPRAYQTSFPHGSVVGQHLRLTYEIGQRDRERLEQLHTENIRLIRWYLEQIAREVAEFNGSLETSVRSTVARRKEKIRADLGFLDALGLPIRRRKDLPEDYEVPIHPRKPRILARMGTTKPFKPEWVLRYDEYENILRILHNMGCAMERSPKTFQRLKEEEIRDFFVVYLNGYYEGEATSETFNYAGRTDILIRHKGKSVFIAECKFWAGKKRLLDTIDQLMRYTTWRGHKTAILFFKKNEPMSSVLDTIRSTVPSHACYKRAHLVKDGTLAVPTISSHVFRKLKDPNREWILTVMVFEVLP